MAITDEIVEKVAEKAYTDGGGKKATLGTDWADIHEFQRDNIREMVRDVLTAFEEVTANE